MEETPRKPSGIVTFATSIIKSGVPPIWTDLSALDLRVAAVAALVVTSLAVVLPLLVIWAFARYSKMKDSRRNPFPFLRLPQELRDMVYENLLEDPAYPPPPPCQHQRSSLDWMIPRRRSATSKASQQAHTSTWIFLANKQVHREYMDMLCKRTTFHLTVSPQNCQPPTDPTNPTYPDDNRIWKIPHQTLKHLRTCSLRLITTSSMLGVTDPRNMTSSDWTLARQIREELKGIENVTNLTLDAKAIGDPLWNPLWIWYHASQSFKIMGTEASDTVPIGPRLNRITFSLDTWSPGENYLERDAGCEGKWAWYCMEGHNVGLDIGPEMTVREFCGKLYQECKVCRPELGSEEEAAL
jgi:hypothetical protein